MVISQYAFLAIGNELGNYYVTVCMQAILINIQRRLANYQSPQK